MMRVATDEAEKAKIKHLLTKEGKEEYLTLIKETVTYADLFEMFPSTVPSLDYLA
jgi:sulfite reductase alpha subunit-like flavoprotein